MQSIIKKDCDFGHNEETEVKNTMDSSLSIEEIQIKQSNNTT